MAEVPEDTLLALRDRTSEAEPAIAWLTAARANLMRQIAASYNELSCGRHARWATPSRLLLLQTPPIPPPLAPCVPVFKAHLVALLRAGGFSACYELGGVSRRITLAIDFPTCVRAPVAVEVLDEESRVLREGIQTGGRPSQNGG